jgi:acyl-CoA synthetase (AMP-forming)/AMP-acid ligase II
MTKKTIFDFNNKTQSLESILTNGATISSSGTTGKPKIIFRTPENLKKVIEVALDSQKISKQSKILTVTRMTHAGGLLAQTLPAFSIGCEIEIKQFNAFSFLKDFENYTHTFLTPTHMDMIVNLKSFNNCDLTGKRILGGSDPVSWNMIEAFVSKGAIVQPNWGMSEVGPITINSEFKNIDDILKYKKEKTILGNTFYTEWKIEDDLLYVKGDLVYKEGWLCTGDIVDLDSGVLYYVGRKNDTN